MRTCEACGSEIAQEGGVCPVCGVTAVPADDETSFRRLTEDQYATLLNAAEDLVFLLDTEQRYVGIWGRWIEDHDLEPEMFLGRTPPEVFGEETRHVFEPMNERVLEGERVSYERWFEVPWGDRIYYHTVLTPLRGPHGDVMGIVGVGRDITKLKTARDWLEHLASHDPLTDLPNRTSFQNAVERAVARARRGVPAALMFLDVDNFKECNDSGGHALGDEVLIRIAQAFRATVREPDIVARIGGDEFGIVLEGATVEGASSKGEALRSAVGAIGEDCGFHLDLSIGIAVLGPDSMYAEALASADRAMYEAKRDASTAMVIAG